MKKESRLKKKTGFTLAETLLAVLIMLMVSSIVAAGIPAAKNAYEKVVLASNAEVLMSTAVSALRNELGTAKDISLADNQTGSVLGTTITYFNAERRAMSRLYVQDNNIMLLRYYFDGNEFTMDTGVVPGPERLIPEKTATGDLQVKYDSVVYDPAKGTITFSGFEVMRGSTVLVQRGTEGKLTIRTISE